MKFIELPAGIIVRSYLARGAVLWVVTRALVSVVIVLARGAPFAFSAVLCTVVLAICLGLLETHQRHEWALIGNLGLRRRVVAILLGLPAVAVEALVQGVRWIIL